MGKFYRKIIWAVQCYYNKVSAVLNNTINCSCRALWYYKVLTGSSEYMQVYCSIIQYPIVIYSML